VPLPSTTLSVILLSNTPPTVGASAATVGGPGAVDRVTALALCPASVIPQSSTLPVTLFFVIELCEVGPVSSVSRIPPALSLTVLDATVE